MRRWVAVVAVVAALAGCRSAPPADAAVLSTVDGTSLIRYAMPDGSPAYLQVIDVRTTRIEQVTGERDPGGAPAAYYPGAPSPAFRQIGPAQVQKSCRDRYGANAFSATNLSFFEDYQASTPLSFPVKAN